MKYVCLIRPLAGAARAAYLRALELARLEPERRFVGQRLDELADAPGDDGAAGGRR